jgi:hypothetical protein
VGEKTLKKATFCIRYKFYKQELKKGGCDGIICERNGYIIFSIWLLCMGQLKTKRQYGAWKL